MSSLLTLVAKVSCDNVVTVLSVKSAYPTHISLEHDFASILGIVVYFIYFFKALTVPFKGDKMLR